MQFTDSFPGGQTPVSITACCPKCAADETHIGEVQTVAKGREVVELAVSYWCEFGHQWTRTETQDHGLIRVTMTIGDDLI